VNEEDAVGPKAGSGRRGRIGGALRVIGGIAALASALAFGVPAGAAASAGCTARGKVLAHKGGVVFWKGAYGNFGGHETGQAGWPVYLCGPPHDRAALVYLESYNTERVSGIQLAGHFVGFFVSWNADGEFGGTQLIVYDLARGRKVLSVPAKCFGGTEECGSSFRPIDAYALSSNGWVAEVDDGFIRYGQPYVQALFATDDGAHLWPIDDSRSISNVKVSKGTLQWMSADGGVSTVKLGPAVVFPGAPPAQPSACQLVTDADAATVLGGPASVTASSQTECVYASQTSATKLSVAVQTGLSQAQVNADENALGSSSNYINLSSSGGNHDPVHRYAETSGSDTQLVEFLHGTVVVIDSDATTADDLFASEVHLGLVALDRLFAIPVQRAN
jgi:hypothetical protein